MKESFQNKFSTDLGKSLLTTLTRYFPPKEFNEALIDIVNILMEGLSRGDVYIDMGETPKNIELQYKGWPNVHMKALLASGWTTGENSPIVLNKEMSVRRLSYLFTWHTYALCIRNSICCRCILLPLIFHFIILITQ